MFYTLVFVLLTSFHTLNINVLTGVPWCRHEAEWIFHDFSFFFPILWMTSPYYFHRENTIPSLRLWPLWYSKIICRPALCINAEQLLCASFIVASAQKFSAVSSTHFNCRCSCHHLYSQCCFNLNKLNILISKFYLCFYLHIGALKQ